MAFNRLEVNDLATATLDDSDQVIVGESNTYKKATVSALKNNILGSSPSYTIDTEPYLMRQTAHTGVVGKCALNKLIGGSLGWNQLVQNGNFASTSNWTAAYGSFTVSGNVATITATAQWGRISQNVSVLSGHKYLFGADLKGTTNNYAQFGTSQYLSGTSWEHISFLYSATSATTVQLMIGDKSTSGWQAFNAQNVQVLDLTAMFGSTIADYVYGLGSTNGITWLRRYIDIDTYHAYDAGSIQSVQATAHVTTGFNQWDEVVELGGINSTTGEDGAGNVLRTKNYIPLLPNTQYYIKVPSKHSANNVKTRFYDGNKGYLGSNGASGVVSKNAVFTPPTNARYVRFQFDDNYGLTYTNDICVNISKTSGTPKNGDYVPYNGHTYPLGSDTLRGIPQLVSNKLQFDGDEKYPDGTIKRKYGSRAYQNGDTSDGATMITDGTTTVYKLATPTTESSTAYQKVQTIDAGGTESFTVSSPVPVGHETQTADNVLAALSWVGE